MTRSTAKDGWKIDSHIASVFTAFEGRAPKSLYRYIPLVQLISVLESGALGLVDPQLWPDKAEAGWIGTLFGSGAPLEGANARAICFTRESYCEALWHVYDRMSPVVRVRFDVDQLLKGARAVSRAFGKVYIGDVIYGDSHAMRSAFVAASSGKFVSSSAAGLLLMKRRAFVYEREVRMLLVAKKAVDDVVAMPTPVEAITQILVSPYAKDWIFDSVQSLLQERYGLKCDVERSTLDRAPRWMSPSRSHAP